MTDPYFYSWFEFSKVRILLEMQSLRGFGKAHRPNAQY